MLVYRAAWVLPISAPPIRGGWVAVDGGVIAGVGGPQDDPGQAGHGAAGRADLGEAVIMPADKPHAVHATERFKMLLVMVREVTAAAG
jgi:hypothetical protein